MPHKIKHMTELKEGDIFTRGSVQLHNREAFLVLDMPKPQGKTVHCISRKSGKESKIRLNGYVTVLNQS